MKFSIITPTHNPTYLKRLDRSIREQTCQDFEWLIVVNGSCQMEDIQVECPQARIIPYRGTTTNIGEIKNFSFNAGRGEILVEADHDDELTANCLEELAKAFGTGVDFAYSNCCEIQNDKPYTYSTQFGWEYRPCTHRGQQLQEAICFAPSPASFSKIWFTPNHVRAWTSRFYKSIGGHDHELDVCDDQDLLARTYIAGEVKHIDKCLYIYHYTGKNTSQGEKNGRIQNLCLDLHDKYIYQLVEKWCDKKKLRKIDLCGGFSAPNGYESVDLANGDITADLDERWPFADGEVGLIRAHDAIEHLKSPLHTMKEAYRCLAPNGWFLTMTPSTDGRGAFQDPTHVSYWNSNSFFYYTKEAQARYINTPVHFQLNRIKNYYPTEWHQLHNIVYVKADLLKYDGRVPGLIEV